MGEGLELQAGLRGDATECDLHTFLKHFGVVCADIGSIVLVVDHDEFQLDAVHAAGRIDLFHGHFSRVFHRDTVDRSTAGQRAGRADVEFRVFGGIVLLPAGSEDQNKRENERRAEYCCDKSFHVKPPENRIYKKEDGMFPALFDIIGITDWV